MSRRVVLIAILVSAALSACKTVPEAPSEGPFAIFEASDYVVAPLPADVPAAFTGCYAASLVCFVKGDPADAEIRYEVQSGRYWFLDQESGLTYYANGDVRTGRNGAEVAGAVEAFSPITNPGTLN